MMRFFCLTIIFHINLRKKIKNFFYRVTGVQNLWLQHRDHCRKLSLTSGKWSSKEKSKSLLCWQSWKKEIRWGCSLHTGTLRVLCKQRKHCTRLSHSFPPIKCFIGWGICISHIICSIIYLLNLLSNGFFWGEECMMVYFKIQWHSYYFEVNTICKCMWRIK